MVSIQSHEDGVRGLGVLGDNGETEWWEEGSASGTSQVVNSSDVFRYMTGPLFCSVGFRSCLTGELLMVPCTVGSLMTVLSTCFEETSRSPTGKLQKGEKMDRKEVQAIIDEVDENGDGKLDYKEVSREQAHSGNAARSRSRAALKELHAKCDVSGARTRTLHLHTRTHKDSSQTN